MKTSPLEPLQPLRHSVPPPLAGEALEPLALSKSFIADKTFPLEPPLVRGGAPKERRGFSPIITCFSLNYCFLFSLCKALIS